VRAASKQAKLCDTVVYARVTIIVGVDLCEGDNTWEIVEGYEDGEGIRDKAPQLWMKMADDRKLNRG